MSQDVCQEDTCVLFLSKLYNFHLYVTSTVHVHMRPFTRSRDS